MVGIHSAMNYYHIHAHPHSTEFSSVLFPVGILLENECHVANMQVN